MTAKPTDQKTDIPSFEILFNGEALSQEFQVLSIVVSMEINRIPKASMAISDGDVAANDFPLSSSELAIPGTEVEIKAGYHSQNETIFKGVITTQRIKAKGKGSTIYLEARSNLFLSTLRKKYRTFEEVTDSEAMEEVLSAYDFSSEVDSTDVTHETMVQFDVTDWDFVLSRAEANSLLIHPAAEGMKAVKPDFSASPVFVLEYGNSVLEFDLEIDSRLSDTAAETYSWDPASQSLVSSEGSDPGDIEIGNLKRADLEYETDPDVYINQGKGNESELQAWSDSKLMRSELARIRGSITGPGFAAVNCGDMVEITGINDRFNGKAFAGGIHHEIAGGTWITDIQIGLDPEFFLESDAVSAGNSMIPGINNLFAGVTVALEGDPEGEDRIQIHIPALHEDGSAIWARLSTLDAGDSRGSVFRPEIDDEVIVGFIGGDPRAAVVLGMLHSSAKPSPIPGSDDNHEKGFISRGEMKIVFNDETNVITLETPGGNTLILSEDEGGIKMEDENGNSLVMDSDGIKIESAGDVNISAPGDVNIEGTNVNAKASAQLVAEGSAGASLEAGGQAVVKGSIVMIN